MALTFRIFMIASLFGACCRAEMIFRGQCSRIFQPQEVGITVDLADVVFNRYVIHPTQDSKSQTDCIGKCLPVTDPPCRSVIYEPWNKTCLLLRAPKNTALDFDVPVGGIRPLRGVLISPQALTDLVADRTNGIKGCDTYCPAPATQSADTITPVCLQDCSGSTAVCAGEMAGCFDYPRKIHYEQTSYQYASFGNLYNFKSFSWQKLHDYTHLRITISQQWTYFDPKSSGTEKVFILMYLNGYRCDGRSGYRNDLRKELKNMGHTDRRWGEPMHGEYICSRYDIKKGSFSLTMSLYREDYVYARVELGPSIGYVAPSFIYVEEIVPAQWMSKLDDMSRCHAATVFNTVERNWDKNWANGNGKTSYYINKYKKRSDTSVLRVYWTGKVYLNAFNKCLRFYFVINDRVCSDPYSIEACVRYNYGSNGYSSCRSDVAVKAFTLDGICRNLPAGRYDIAMFVDNSCIDYGTDANWYYYYHIGYSRSSQMVVEEIHEEIPINSLLLDNGESVQLPYYNRKYFNWYSYCHNSGNCGGGCYGTCVGSPFKSFTYNKLQTGSALHVKWYGGQESCYTGYYFWHYTAIKWYIKINGVECSSPTKIESWHVDWYTRHGICQGHPKYVEGICTMPIPAGPVTLELQIGYPYSGNTGMWQSVSAGKGGPSYLMVEEVIP